MAVMDQHQDDFSNVSWNTDEHTAAESSSSVTATEYDEDADRNGHHTYESDAPGNDDDREVLDCTVSEPLKENEGSKDTFVSYLITTNVSESMLLCRVWLQSCDCGFFAR